MVLTLSKKIRLARSSHFYYLNLEENKLRVSNNMEQLITYKK